MTDISLAPRMDVELGVPATLFELLKGGRGAAGFSLGKVYFLELRHGLMGFFPAIFSADEGRIVVTANLELLERVWQMLEPHEANLRTATAYINETRGIFYVDRERQIDREEEVPRRLLTPEEFDSLAGEERPFEWAFGLMGGRRPSKESFLADLTMQARVLEPSFAGNAG